VLRLVAENAGITVRELGARLGVDATGLYRVVNRLTGEGRLRKEDTRLYAVETPAAPTAAEQNVAGSSEPQVSGTGAATTTEASAPSEAEHAQPPDTGDSGT
jgi:DNA-binding Lrp family transcriptional regulator